MQTAWIQNLSIKENILFMREYDDAKYNAVLDACALRDDIAQLARGDDTLGGLRGVNLSGGQRQRVNLARAAYTDADTVLLDAPLRCARLRNCQMLRSSDAVQWTRAWCVRMRVCLQWHLSPLSKCLNV